jgi:hypothetical protein
MIKVKHEPNCGKGAGSMVKFICREESHLTLGHQALLVRPRA